MSRKIPSNKPKTSTISKVRSELHGNIKLTNPLPSIPLEGNLFETPLTDAILEQYSAYSMDQYVALQDPLPFCDMFLDCHMPFVDPNQYAWPKHIDKQVILDPQDAILVSDDLLDHFRSYTRHNINIPLPIVVSDVRKQAEQLTTTFTLESRELTKEMNAFNKPIFAPEDQRRVATKEAIRDKRVNFLFAPEYSADKVHESTKIDQKMEQARENSKLKLNQNNLKEKISLPTYETPYDYVLDSFNLINNTPVHPNPKYSGEGPIIRPILPSSSLIDKLQKNRPIRFCWVGYPRLEDVISTSESLEPEEVERRAEELRSTGLDMTLLFQGSEGNDEFRKTYGQYKRKIGSITVDDHDYDVPMSSESKEILENEEEAIVWNRELITAPSAQLVSDDSYLITYHNKDDSNDVGNTSLNKNAVHLSKYNMRVNLRRRVHSAQDVCDRLIGSRPVVLQKKESAK